MTPSAIAISRILSTVGSELSRSAARADRLQHLPAEWLAADPSNLLVLEAQDLDLLVQELRGLSQYCLRLAELSHSGRGLDDATIALVGSDLTVGRLAQRLTASAAHPPDGGEVELW